MSNRARSFAELLRRSQRQQESATAALQKLLRQSESPGADLLRQSRALSANVQMLSDSALTTAERVGRWTPPLTQLQQEFRAFDDLMARTREPLKALSGLSEKISAFGSSTSAVAALAREFAVPSQANNLRDLIEAVQRTVAKARPELEKIRAESNAAAGVTGVELPASAATQLGTGETSVGAAKTLRDSPLFRTGVDWIDGLPLYQGIFVLVLLWQVLPSFLGSLLAGYVLRESSQRPLQIVVQEVYERSEGESLETLRCVRASLLRVRNRPNLHADIVGYRAKGQAVEVLDRKGAWSFIRYVPKGAPELATGWASTSYLSRVACSL